MKKNNLKYSQQGALMFVTLIILLIVSVLGISTMDTTGLEMKMSSNSRDQQQAFEAAEYALSWAENDIQTNSYSGDQLSSVNCGTTCFDPTCSNGYCFDGSGELDFNTCILNTPTTEPYESAALWADGSGLYRTVTVMGVTVKYITEFRCYTALDPELPIDVANNTKVFRITAFATGSGGKSRAMLRSTMKEI